MKFIKKIIIKLNVINIFSIPFYLFRIFKINPNKIVCVNFSGKGFGDNPKPIVEELLKRNKDYDIVWLVKNTEDKKFPDQVRKVKIYSLKYFYEMATAKIWINNSRFPLFVRKRKHQYYINTWHGGLGLKKIEKDAAEKLSEYYKKAAPHDSSLIDITISNSTYRTNIFKNSFWYNGPVLECGSPRNDIFFKKEVQKEMEKKIKNLYNISEDQKIILYVPTFRITDFNYNSIDYEKLLKNLKKKEKVEYVFMVRLHSRVKEINLPSNVINATSYPDANELLLAADILISDYSSIMFDFIYRKKPVYLYAPDYESYMKERGLNFVYTELPFSLSYTSEELIKNITENKAKDYEKKLKQFLKDMGVVDKGTAAKEVADLITRVTEEGKTHEKI